MSSSSHPSFPPPGMLATFLPDGELVLIPASASTPAMMSSTPASTSSSASPLSFLDPFGIFSPPRPPSPQPQSRVPPPHQPIRPDPVSQRGPSSSSSSSLSPLLLLGAGVAGVSLLATASTTVFLRRSLLGPLTRVGHAREKTLTDLKRGLSRVEERLAGLEDRVPPAPAGVVSSGEGGALAGETKEALQGLRSEIEGMRKDLDCRMYEMEDALRENGASTGGDEVWAAGPPTTEHSLAGADPALHEGSERVETSAGANSMSASPDLATSTDGQPIDLVNLQHASTDSAVRMLPPEVKMAIDASCAKIDGQTARDWVKAFDKATIVAPPVVSAEESIHQAWEDAFKTKRNATEEFNRSAANLAVNPEAHQVVRHFEEVRKDAGGNGGGSASAAASINVAFVELAGTSPLPFSVTSSPSAPSPSAAISSSADASKDSADNVLPPASDPTPPSPSNPTSSSTLAMDLDLAASIASRIDQHWYSAKSSSSPVNEPTHTKSAQPSDAHTSSRATSSFATSSPSFDKHQEVKPDPAATSAASSGSTSSPKPTSDAKSPTGSHGRRTSAARRHQPSPSAAFTSPPPTTSEPTMMTTDARPGGANWHVAGASWVFPPGFLVGGGFSATSSASFDRLRLERDGKGKAKEKEKDEAISGEALDPEAVMRRFRERAGLDERWKGGAGGGRGGRGGGFESGRGWGRGW